MNIQTKYSFVEIKVIATNEYLHTSNKKGVSGKKMIIEIEVVHKNQNTLNNKGNDMNNELTDIAQDINMDDAEKELQNILDKNKDYPEEYMTYKLLNFGSKLYYEIGYFEDFQIEVDHFNHLKKFIAQYVIPRMESLEEKVFKLAVEHMRTDDEISQCIMSVTRSSEVQMERYIFLLEKLLDIKTESHHIEHMLDDLYEYKLPVTHSDAERISSLLNYPIPACRGEFSLLPTK